MTAEKNYRSGYVIIAGKPNVGKSTLINAILKQKIAAVSFRPQTTQRRQLGILTTPDAQIIFMDTPGMHQGDFKLSQFINEEARIALGDGDVLLFLVDVLQKPDDEDIWLAKEISKLEDKPVIFLVLNKVDQADPAWLHDRIAQYAALLEVDEIIEISAQNRINVDGLLEKIITHLPEGDPFYPEDQVTDYYERQICEELIRAACLTNLKDEIPYGVAVQVQEFSERPDESAYIVATIYVERESHKGIVIGKGGDMIRLIGSQARKEIEEACDRKVFLDLKVKEAKNWRNDLPSLKRFGYKK